MELTEGIIKKASELSKQYAITTCKDGYDVTEYPDVTMLYKMAEYVQKQMLKKAITAGCQSCGLYGLLECSRKEKIRCANVFKRIMKGESK